MTVLSPFGPFRALDNNGLPLNGGKLYTYEAGTSTPKATYTDSSGAVANANPVILNSAGYANVWLGSGGYKFTLTTSTDATLWTIDDIGGDSQNAFGSSVVTTAVNLAITSVHRNALVRCTASLTLSLLSASGAGQGFYFLAKNESSGNVTIDPSGAETIDGLATYILYPGDSVIVICDGATWYTSFAIPVAGITTNQISTNGASGVVVKNSAAATVATFGASAGTASTFAGATTTTGIATFSNAVNQARATAIASAATTDIGAVAGNFVHITGATTITGLGTITAGAQRTVIFDGALTLTHNATSLILPGAANITTAANDMAIFVSEGSGNWRCISYIRNAQSPTILQIVGNQTGAVATGTTVIPFDDTIPQNTEGDQYLTQSITPKSATSTLIIEASLFVSVATSNQVSVALFQDSNVNALAATPNYVSTTASAGDTIILRHRMTSGTTSSTTFNVRAGLSSAGTLTINGVGGARRFGGVAISNITITEIL